jgi:hypothetical protein
VAIRDLCCRVRIGKGAVRARYEHNLDSTLMIWGLDKLELHDKITSEIAGEICEVTQWGHVVCFAPGPRIEVHQSERREEC